MQKLGKESTCLFFKDREAPPYSVTIFICNEFMKEDECQIVFEPVYFMDYMHQCFYSLSSGFTSICSVVLQLMDSQRRLGGDKTMDLTNGGLKSYSRFSDQWKQMADAEKKATLNAEMDRMKVLPGSSNYAAHRIRVLNKVLELVSKQVITVSFA